MHEFRKKRKHMKRKYCL